MTYNDEDWCYNVPHDLPDEAWFTPNHYTHLSDESTQTCIEKKSQTDKQTNKQTNKQTKRKWISGDVTDGSVLLPHMNKKYVIVYDMLSCTYIISFDFHVRS